MKKYLYGTTILAAVGLATGPVLAEETPIHLELGGGYSEYFGFSSQDVEAETGTGNEVAFMSHEVHFKIRGELANGLSIGGAIELEGESGGDQIDQAYVTLSGGFGVLRLGGINSGRYSMILGSPDVGLGSNSGSQGKYMTTTDNGGPSSTTYIDISGDSQKITYFTPRFNGFQLAAGWAPNATDQTGGNDPGLASDATTYTDAWDFGLSYKGDFEDASISAMVGVGGADAPNVAEAAGFDDFLVWNAGLSIGFGGFTVAATVVEVSDGQASLNDDDDVVSNKGSAWTVGAAYNTGPWGISVSRFEGDSKGLIAKTDKTEGEFWTVGASYTIGPGLRTSLTYLNGDTTDQAGTSFNNTGHAVIAGIHIGF